MGTLETAFLGFPPFLLALTGFGFAGPGRVVDVRFPFTLSPQT
jgi:hypothetical protein